MMEAMTSRTLGLGSTTLSIAESGHGAPIVFLHAFPLSSRMWERQLATLPDGWRGVAPDFRGFGASPRGTSPARHVGDHAADVLALIAALESGPVVLAGLSMGGYVAFECWRRQPSAIRGLVLADTRAEADSDEAKAKRVATQQKAAQEGTAVVIDGMLPGLLGETTRTRDPHLARTVREWAMENAPEGVIDGLEALRTRPDSRPTLTTITCPTLVIVGEQDTLTPPDLSRVIADGISNATLVTIPDAGHLANVEQPDAFDATLHTWLQTLTA